MEATSTPSLKAELEAIVANIPEPIEMQISNGNALVGTGGPYGIRVGSPAPSFTLANATGAPVDLASHLEQGPVVLTFYRGDWCPFCNLELRALQAIVGDLEELGATLIAISPQSPDHALVLTAEHELGFEVLSDLDQSTIAAYGLLYDINDITRELMTNVFHSDLAIHNADGTWRLPIPATFVLDEHGIVRERYVNVDYRTRMEPADILEAVRQIAATRT